MNRLLWLSLLLVGCQGGAPDIVGTVTLAPMVSAPSSGTLVIRARPATSATETLQMESIRERVDSVVNGVTFPYSFRLHGSGDRVGNLSWQVDAWVAADAMATAPVTGELAATQSILFDCNSAQTSCQDAQVQLPLE